MTRLQRLSQVELPLAAPVIMAGIRTAAVWTIGAATLATPVGATSLGDYIFSGLQTEDWAAVATGCAGSAGLALAVDGLLALVESGLGRSSRPRIATGAAGLALIGALAVFGARGGSSEHRVVVGAKNFSEQYILADLIATRLRAAGMPVEIRSGLGSAVAFRALAAGDIDVYVDYAGTLATTVLKRTDNPALPALTADLERRTGVGVVGPLGFENAYVLAMRPDTAKRLGIRSIADLAAQAPRLTLGADLEFQTRPEWRAIVAAYGLRFGTARSYEPTFMYRALSSAARTSSPPSPATGGSRHSTWSCWRTLATRSRPMTRCCWSRPRRRGDAAFRAALKPLVGSISVERMQAANLLVDRDTDKRSAAEAAATLAR